MDIDEAGTSAGTGDTDGLRGRSLGGSALVVTGLVFHRGGVRRAGLLDTCAVTRKGLVPIDTASGEGLLVGRGDGRRTTRDSNGGGVGDGTTISNV